MIVSAETLPETTASPNPQLALITASGRWSLIGLAVNNLPDISD
jgi:hypothetical protein